MFRYPDETFKTNPPAKAVLDGCWRTFADLTREQWDGLGYNEAVPAVREPYTTYETAWAKGEDLIYRETVVTAVVDEEARTTALADAARAGRDRLLAASDWTQLADSVLDETAQVLWQSYRQALRDVPQQAGFPTAVEWPTRPETE
ncbi:tail fiber assembly protein [Pseudodesulfovibrio sp.]|uniref:tail fiber assembly protein n=1 Tax=Pseudodesulfovibrio sp. TaxID=2035812 RepID=UPI002635F518|nr:tail fiber assembly protein [Pseudodesulfovibrio sp.]MDD3311305.1 tail fiber assembly protein [Pseudodesulfovibrio sp.]